MRELLVIGIGAGDPDQVTVQAIKAMNRADTFFIIGKGDEKQALVDLRTGILDEHVQPRLQGGRDHGPAAGPKPRPTTRASSRTGTSVRAAKFEAEFAAEPGVGAILVWGDPSLYDSTLRIVERVLARGRVLVRLLRHPGNHQRAVAGLHNTGSS